MIFQPAVAILFSSTNLNTISLHTGKALVFQPFSLGRRCWRKEEKICSAKQKQKTFQSGRIIYDVKNMSLLKFSAYRDCFRREENTFFWWWKIVTWCDWRLLKLWWFSCASKPIRNTRTLPIRTRRKKVGWDGKKIYIKTCAETFTWCEHYDSNEKWWITYSWLNILCLHFSLGWTVSSSVVWVLSLADGDLF